MKEAMEAEFTKNEVMKKNGGGKDFEKSSILILRIAYLVLPNSKV